MAEHVCEKCGASNGADATFCHACDTYLGWDKGATTIGGHPVTATVPDAVETVRTEAALPRVVLPAGSAAPVPAGEAPSAASPAQPDGVAAPRVHLTMVAAALLPDGAVTVPVEVSNTSSVVDGFVLTAQDPPGWLEVSHPPLRLMPQHDGVIELSVQARSGTLVQAQRFSLGLTVASEADPTKTAHVRLVITVPPHGPPPTLTVQPRLLRLTDSGRERFVLHLDNRAANFPQTFTLAGSDPEGVVRFGFLPSVVEVPPGQVVEVRGHFVAPLPEPGRDVDRPLTLSATNDEGTLTAVLTVVQHTSPEPEEAPVTMRLSPRELRLTNTALADFEVHIDNRGGHADRTLSLHGRDPAHLVSFLFTPDRVTVAAGQVTVVRGRLRTVPVARGQSDTRAFTVVATDGVSDTEAPGLLEVSASPAPLTTADLRVTPQHLTRADERRGSFTVEVDNARGQEPLPVWLSGSDAHGMARLSFTPAQLTVPAGQVAVVGMVVDCPPPPRGQSATRELAVVASDGEGRVEAEASFTQVSSDRRPLLRTLLVLLGALLVLLGALLPWFLRFGDADGLTLVLAAVEIQNAGANELLIAAAGLRVLLGVLALAMVFGLTGRAGSLTRKSALLAVLLTAGYVVTVVTLGFAFVVSVGLVAVGLGAVLAYIGGVLARQQ